VSDAAARRRLLDLIGDLVLSGHGRMAPWAAHRRGVDL